jgi:DNA phosphorothioation-dependent restriction protein DptH
LAQSYLPVEEGQVPFLLDYLPGQRFLGVSTFLTSKPGAELVHLLAPVMQVLTGAIAPALLASLTQTVLNDLRTVSGSLVMKLSNQPHQTKVLEYAGIALAKRLLEKQGLLNYQFIIPIDLHQHFFKANEENTSQSRADLLLVDVDPLTNTIHVQVVEIKVRTAELSSGEWSNLCEQMSDQLTNTITHLRQRFDFEHFANHIRFDQPLRSRELSELLQFYAERAARYGLLTEGEPERLRIFFTQLTKVPYQMEFTRRGIVFNLDNPVKVQRDEYGDTVYYRIGRPGIEALLDSESTFNTRRPTPEWHRLRTDLTRRRPDEPAILPTNSPLTASDTATVINNTEIDTHTGANLLPAAASVADATLQTEQAAISVDSTSKTTGLASLGPLDANSDIAATNSGISSAVASGPGNLASEATLPAYNIYVGENEPSSQYGMLGRTPHGQNVALDLNGTQTISLFGVQGAGKSYSIGTITEMVLQSIPHVNALPKPLAGVIFHYSESQDYKPEFTSMTSPNRRPGEVSRLQEWYDARPQGIDDVVLVVPKAKLAERQAEYPDLRVEPLALSSAELSIQDWRFLMGAVGSQALYMKHLNSIMRDLRGNLTLLGLRNAIQNSALLNTSQRELALSRLTLAAEYLDDSVRLGQLMAPGRLLVVDLRDEFLDQDDALGLFVIMLNIFANARLPDGQPFNKFIVFDEAHKYMGNQELTGSIVTAIREMRHKGVSLLIASQDPPSLPNAIIELSTAVLIHRFNSPQWLKHVQKSIVQFDKLTPADLSQLGPGEAFLWATKATNKLVTQQPIKITTRPRVTQHGGSTIRAAE